MQDLKIKTFNYGIFSIEVCQNCLSYRLGHDPSLVFHGVNIDDLKMHSGPILTPKGTPQAPFYFQVLDKRYLHLGPLNIVGILPPKDKSIWLGFDIKKLKMNGDTRFIDYKTWVKLGFYRNSFIEDDKKELEKILFREEYGTSTEVLVSQLNCNIADYVIVTDKESSQLAKQFAKKDLESSIFPLSDAKNIWDDYFENLQHSDEEWERFANDLDYRFHECNCKF